MRAGRLGWPEPRRPLALALGAGAVILLVVGVLAAVASWSLARAGARDDAVTTTGRISEFLVGPLLARSLAGDAVAGDELRRAVANRMSDRSVRQVTVWSADGAVVFSSEPRLVGRRAPVAEDLARAARGEHSAEIVSSDDLGTLDPDHPVVEVYVPMRAAPGLVLEVYHDAEEVQRRTSALAVPVLAVSVLPLVLLQVVQVPVLSSLVSRVRRGARERADLLERALTASERERRQIAAGLHDTVVQDLAGAGYALAAVADRVPAPQRRVVGEVTSTLAGTVDALRRLMLDLHPPDLCWGGLGDAVERLADPLRGRGLAVTVDVESCVEPDPAATVAAYRIVRECLVNVVKHAGAGQVRVEISSTAVGVRLLVADDGSGIDPHALAVARPGHLGTALVRDCVDSLGGRLRWLRGPGGGTRVEVDLPPAPTVPAVARR